jgi:lysophospholipase L1-like esterase
MHTQSLRLASIALLSACASAALAGEARSRPGERGEFVMGALGDSISVAYDATYAGANYDLSWSTGDVAADAVNTHFVRLQAIRPEHVVAYNEAFLGATSYDLAGQTDELVTAHPDYVTLMIGANDLCNWYGTHPGQVEGVDARVTRSIDRLVASNPAVKILLVPVPDMRQMYELGKDRECRLFWDLFGICSPLLGDRTDAQREDFYARWAALNESYAAIAAARPANVRFARRVMEGTFDETEISSVDCFHPSLEGQRHLADDTWADGWFQ